MIGWVQDATLPQADPFLASSSPRVCMWGGGSEGERIGAR